MIDTNIKTISCLVIYLAISVPMQVTANRCECSPKEWDFGDVTIGSSSTVIFSLTNFKLDEVAMMSRLPRYIYLMKKLMILLSSFHLRLSEPILPN